MRNETDGVLNKLVTNSIDTAQARLHGLEKDANKVLRGVRSKRKATQAQVADFFAKMEPTELLESAHKAEKQWSKKASRVGADVLRRVGTLQADLLRFVGVASHGEIEAIANDIEKISRKIDRLVREGKRPSPRIQKALKAPISDA